ncbi:MAG TPA: NADH-quinone oxidoreductase subunit I [Candidatus Limnocylindria bacterium]|jgi:NADH-quinone oxidoreductase subunit I|nr:NADH-quinone oxidoreductase subunit I [Candidatus Limnocylindria bacterium]
MDTRRLTLGERLYLPQVVEGLAVTTRHFARNLALHILHLFGLARDKAAAVTTQYPEQRKPYSEGFRGAHRLTLKPDGSVRCTACFLCATACPAKCIYIEAGEHPDPEVEKYPVRYEIDTLQCIYCGMCVEACPCDAIRMDTFVHPRVWGYRREDFIETKAVFMERSRILEERGRDALMEDMQRAYREGRDVGPAVKPKPA